MIEVRTEAASRESGKNLALTRKKHEEALWGSVSVQSSFPFLLFYENV